MGNQLYVLGLWILALLGCSSTGTSELSRSDSTATPISMIENIEFNERSLSSFAVSSTTILISDSRGVFYLKDRTSEEVSYAESGLDFPKVAVADPNIVATGRWNPKVQWWKFGNPLLQAENELADMHFLSLAAFQNEVMLAVAPIDKSAPSNPLKDQVHYKGWTSFREVSETGKIELATLSDLTGIVRSVAFNAEYFLVCTKAQPQTLQWKLRHEEKSSVLIPFELKYPVTSLAVESSGLFYIATEQAIYTGELQGVKPRVSEVAFVGDDFASILKLVVGPDRVIYGMTSEGVYSWDVNGKIEHLTTEQPVDISVVDGELWVLENLKGLYTPGTPEKWHVKL